MSTAVDFQGDVGFVARELARRLGEVLALDATSVVFRLTGKPGPPIRFRFRIEE